MLGTVLDKPSKKAATPKENADPKVSAKRKSESPDPLLNTKSSKRKKKASNQPTLFSMFNRQSGANKVGVGAEVKAKPEFKEKPETKTKENKKPIKPVSVKELELKEILEKEKAIRLDDNQPDGVKANASISTESKAKPKTKAKESKQFVKYMPVKDLEVIESVKDSKAMDKPSHNKDNFPKMKPQSGAVSDKAAENSNYSSEVIKQVSDIVMADTVNVASSESKTSKKPHQMSKLKNLKVNTTAAEAVIAVAAEHDKKASLTTKGSDFKDHQMIRKVLSDSAFASSKEIAKKSDVKTIKKVLSLDPSLSSDQASSSLVPNDAPPKTKKPKKIYTPADHKKAEEMFAAKMVHKEIAAAMDNMRFAKVN
jgi:hypothetical protein